LCFIMDYNSLVFKQFTILITISFMLMLTACNAAESAPVEFVITSTLPPTLTPQATATSAPPTATSTPAPVKGTTTTQLNVRAGPSTDSAVLGMIAPFVKVQIFGKDPSGSWLQINYPQGADGKGWVATTYIKTDGADDLPIVAETSQTIGTETPTGISISPSPMPALIISAKNDGDSAESPAVNVNFSANGTRSFLYSGDLSSGDGEDWIQFTPYQPGVLIQLSCVGSAELNAEVVQNGETIFKFVKCGNTGIYMLNSGQAYLIHISATNPDVLEYTSYTLKVENIQP